MASIPVPGLFVHSQSQTLLYSGCLHDKLHGKGPTEILTTCAACFQMTFRALLVGLLLGIAFSLITLKLNITAGEWAVVRRLPRQGRSGKQTSFWLDAMLSCLLLHLVCQKQRKTPRMATSLALCT